MRPAASNVLAFGSCLALVLFGCKSGLPGPATGPHRAQPDTTATVISYPPPAVKVECVPEQPRDECVWVDGSWKRSGSHWEWQVGAWVVPPSGCYYAAAYSQWIRVGPRSERDQLYYFEAAWYPQTPTGSCAEPRVCQNATTLEDC